MTLATILFFGRLAEQFGAEREIEMPAEGCTIGALKARLFANEEDATIGKVLTAVDQVMASDELHVRPDQEIAFFSPLSGG